MKNLFLILLLGFIGLQLQAQSTSCCKISPDGVCKIMTCDASGKTVATKTCTPEEMKACQAEKTPSCCSKVASACTPGLKSGNETAALVGNEAKGQSCASQKTADFSVSQMLANLLANKL